MVPQKRSTAIIALIFALFLFLVILLYLLYHISFFNLNSQPKTLKSETLNPETSSSLDGSRSPSKPVDGDDNLKEVLGDIIKVPKTNFQLEADISDRALYLTAGGQTVKKYDITVGSVQTPTPKGEFKVINKMRNPTWYSPNGAVAPDDPKNELGSRWMGIESKEISRRRSFGIHGTIRPEAIGKADSTGCIRLINSEVEELFDLVAVGTTLVIKE